MLVEFFDRSCLKTIELFMSNPARPFRYSEIMKEGKYGTKDTNLVPGVISKMVETEMIKITNPEEADAEDFEYICNIKSKIIVNLMNIDIELLQRDLELKKSMRARAYTYQPKTIVSSPPVEEPVKTEPEAASETKTPESG